MLRRRRCHTGWEQGIYAANKSAGCWREAQDARLGGRTRLVSQNSVFDSRWHRETPQVYVLVVWFLSVRLVWTVLSSWLVEMMGKGQGTPKSWPARAAPSWASASGEAEHEPATSSNFNSKSMTQFP